MFGLFRGSRAGNLFARPGAYTPDCKVPTAHGALVAPYGSYRVLTQPEPSCGSVVNPRGKSVGKREGLVLRNNVRSLGLHRVLTPYLAALCSRTRLYLAPYGRCA